MINNITQLKITYNSELNELLINKEVLFKKSHLVTEVLDSAE